MDKKESFYWDLVKGTAIFLMLWGHCIQYCGYEEGLYFYNYVYRMIYSFHMPVFMLVSGYLFYYSFQKRNISDLLEHRIRGMLHPIIMVTFLNNGLMLIPQYIMTGRVDFLFGKLFYGMETDLWFLWAVLYCSIIVGICGKLTQKPYLQICLMVMAVFVILLLPQWNMTLFMYPYFVVGFFCGKYRNKAKRLYRSLRYAMLVIFPYMVMFYRPKHYIYMTPMFSEELGLAASFHIALFRWIIGFLGSIWLLFLLECFLKLGNRLPAVHQCLRSVSHLGRNSLQIYCLSVSLLSGYLPHLYRKFVELIGSDQFIRQPVVYNLLFTPLLAMLWAVILCYAIVLLKKCRLHQLFFGR